MKVFSVRGNCTVTESAFGEFLCLPIAVLALIIGGPDDVKLGFYLFGNFLLYDVLRGKATTAVFVLCKFAA
jgi:hypothetical protein